MKSKALTQRREGAKKFNHGPGTQNFTIAVLDGIVLAGRFPQFLLASLRLCVEGLQAPRACSTARAAMTVIK
jgi:hypothetical protein